MATLRDEPDVVDAAAIAIRRLLDDLQPDLVVGPLGIGDHIDHAVTNRVLNQCAIEPERLRWYEDVPYVLYPHTRGSVEQVSQKLRPGLIPITAEHWSSKIAAIACYRSQLGVLWRNTTPWPEQMMGYATQVGGASTAERLWSSQ